jgi:hypothetical protein
MLPAQVEATALIHTRCQQFYSALCLQQLCKVNNAWKATDVAVLENIRSITKIALTKLPHRVSLRNVDTESYKLWESWTVFHLVGFGPWNEGNFHNVGSIWGYYLQRSWRVHQKGPQQLRVVWDRFHLNCLWNTQMEGFNKQLYRSRDQQWVLS